MPYVIRDADGQIVAVHAIQSAKAEERLQADDAELREFIAATSDSANLQNVLLASDLELVRVLEDLIAVLIDKRIIMLTDLPQAAQRKLARRYELRSRLNDLGSIVAEQDEIMLP
jgi:FMN phosphatase YigB (HAD superfamily)